MFQKLDAFTKKVADFADQPSGTPDEIKAQFDAAPEELRTYFNNLVDALTIGNWNYPSLLSGWAPAYNGESIPAYKKDPFGFVHLKGTVRSGGIGQGNPIFTLPNGYRPSEKLRISCTTHDGTNYLPGRISIDANGNMWLDSGANASVYIDSISFLAEQ